MEYTKKTGCNRRNSESRIVKLCLNVMPSRDGGRRTVNPLSLRDLGGGIGFAVTSSFTYRYRAFRRCQTMALVEGFVRLYILNVYETDTMNNKLKKNIMKETKKKNYESPSIKVYEMRPMQILNASATVNEWEDGGSLGTCDVE